MKILGIDEAGRGSVLGPLIVAGVLVPQEKIHILERLDVKDSKKLPPRKRRFLARKIRKIAECYTVKISASEIDEQRSDGVNLNEIELGAIIEIIKKSQPDKVIIDSIDVKPHRLEKRIKRLIGGNIKIKAEHGADSRYYPVAAASITAKVERDLEMEKLERRYHRLGRLGSGYPSDPHTKTFLNKFNHKKLPKFVRRSWKTVKKNEKK